VRHRVPLHFNWTLNTGRIFLNILVVFKIHFHEQHHGPASDGSLHGPMTPEAKGDYSIGDLFIFSSYTLQFALCEQNAEELFSSVVSFLDAPSLTL
jgi:hypothetical protein